MTENTILSNKCYLYLTEFFAGMSVMAVELGASSLYGHFCFSVVSAWHGNAVHCQVRGGQSG
jgi:hypothetical protein